MAKSVGAYDWTSLDRDLMEPKVRLNLIKMFFVCAFVFALDAGYGADLPFVNWENHPIHALDLSPDHKTLAVAHTADQRVQLFDVSTGSPIPMGHVLVGVDPVSVRFRSNSELWAVNHVSDSISVIDVVNRQIRSTLHTGDEPFDVVFAANKAFVSCSQVNKLAVFDLDNLSLAPREIAISAQDPRALATSPDGKTVYAAIFESGNASTALFGGFSRSDPSLPNVVNDVRGPYGGANPPPNSGASFNPPVNPLALPPRVSLIVRRDASHRWMDDNQHDWTRFVSGDLAGASRRVQGWDVVDRDIAAIDAASLSVRYVTGLMNIGMALAVKPSDGEVTLVGTDSSNEIRYEPNVKGRFVKVEMARVPASLGVASSSVIVDLNPHLNPQLQTAPQTMRDQSLGDPRAIVWRQDGGLAWVAGMGSNNVIAIDGLGRRIGAPIRTGAGPAGIALDEVTARLYVWNHFDASLSVIDTGLRTEIARLPVFNPLPQAIRNGRAFLYDTQRTSGLGQASCASCHIDARMDQLAWDLGDPSAPPAAFDQNCATVKVAPCTAYHAMKGPMTTQTLQDIIGHEPLHWRGDRRGIEAFNPAFVGLLGDDAPLSDADMSAFKAFLATITFPPNPYRALDNSLPESLPLHGQRTSGRFLMVGLPLGTGNARRGLQLYTGSFLDSQFQCASCHTLPTGMAVNGAVRSSILNFSVGMGSLPIGPLGENHLGVVSTDGFTNVSIKVPQTRNMQEKVGMEFSSTESLSGFGFAHDGTVDSLADFFSAALFSPTSDQDSPI
jgi:YVTN family beta-propeller protein